MPRRERPAAQGWAGPRTRLRLGKVASFVCHLVMLLLAMRMHAPTTEPDPAELCITREHHQHLYATLGSTETLCEADQLPLLPQQLSTQLVPCWA